MYQLLSGKKDGIKRLSDSAYIPKDLDNADWKAYQDWIAEGNTPDPADIPAEATYQEKRKAAYPPIEDFLDAKVKQGSSDPVIRAEGVQAEADYVAACLVVKAKYTKGTI